MVTHLCLQGYRHASEFIVTRDPLPAATGAFWRTVWDNNAHVIVSLRAGDEVRAAAW